MTAATHKEAVALILGRTRLELKVRSGGLIPVKLSRSDPVTWHQTDTLKTSSTTDSEVECPERRISISLTGHQGLGCSICKVRTNDILIQ